MGDEWKKQQKSAVISSFILSGIMFFNSYLSHGSTNVVLEIDFKSLLLISLPIIVITNISLLLHIRKVDRSDSELDLKGYFWKFNIIAVVGGIAFGFILFIFTICYILSNI